MDNNKGTMELALGSWIAAFAVGTVAGTMLWFLGGWGFLQAAFIGCIVFVVLGVVLSWAMMRPLPGPNELNLTTPPVPSKTPPTASATNVAATQDAAVAAPVAAKPVKKPAPAAPKPAAKKAAPAKKAAAPVAAAADARPAMMTDAPADGQADDLKKISGVGPKLEQTLNDLGIWQYEQVAKLKKKDIAWVDERLRFKGRIERDDWVGQAKELAKAKG